VRLTGECARIAADLKITRWHVSLSHIETHATASAIGMK
jgi:phosphopantetheinyl transferase (holo-ACP synthase)